MMCRQLTALAGEVEMMLKRFVGLVQGSFVLQSGNCLPMLAILALDRSRRWQRSVSLDGRIKDSGKDRKEQRELARWGMKEISALRRSMQNDTLEDEAPRAACSRTAR